MIRMDSSKEILIIAATILRKDKEKYNLDFFFFYRSDEDM